MHEFQMEYKRQGQFKMNSTQEDSSRLCELEGRFSRVTWQKQKEFSRVGTSLKKLCLGNKHKQSYTVGG